MTNDDMPWVNLTQEEVEKLRNQKYELTQYGKDKIKDRMIAADYQLIAKELYETLKQVRELIDDGEETKYISRWNPVMPRVDAAIEYYEDYVNGL